MTLEMEVKVLNVDLDQMEEKLKNLGARLISHEEQINYLIDDSRGSIEKDTRGYLRLRETKDLRDGSESLVMTFKKNVESGLTRNNIEKDVHIDRADAKNLLDILAYLGYDQVTPGRKERRSYIYEDMRFDLDSWDEKTYPYPYMEIELVREEDLEKAIEFLDLDRSNISRKSITELRESLD